MGVCYFLTAGSAPYFPVAGLGHDRYGDRPARLLSFGGMGHHASTSGAEREVLQLLRGALPRYQFQHHPPSQDALLYRQLDHPLCRNIVSVGAGVLPAL